MGTWTTDGRRNRNTGDRRWRRIRDVVLARDGYRCQVGGPPCIGTASVCGHIIAGAGDALDNLQAECKPCSEGHWQDRMRDALAADAPFEPPPWL